MTHAPPAAGDTAARTVRLGESATAVVGTAGLDPDLVVSRVLRLLAHERRHDQG